MAGSVQFYGKDEVLQAFENRRVQLWSIWQGSQYMFKGEGANELDTHLDTLQHSDATYTLKVYEDIKDLAKLKSNTPNDGSFNFKLSIPFNRMNGIPGSNPGGYYPGYWGDKKLEDRLQKLEALILKKSEEPEEKQTLQEAVISGLGNLLSNPNELASLLLAAKELFRPAAPAVQSAPVMPANPYQAAPRPASLGAVSTSQGQGGKEYSETEIQRMQDAIDKLCDLDERLPDHLEKLAAIGEKNPAQFKFLLSTLDTMQL